MFFHPGYPGYLQDLQLFWAKGWSLAAEKQLPRQALIGASGR